MARSWNTCHCLVTGGAGFGGAHLCQELVRRGARVYVLDRERLLNSYFVVAGVERSVEFIRGDIRDRARVLSVIGQFKIDTVFHLAAQPLVPVSNMHPWETLEINALGTYAVLEAVRQAGGSQRLVVASSGAYYGATTTDQPIGEDQSPLVFTNIYAASKVAADAVVRAYARVYGMQVGICRFMNTYGPGDNNFSRIVPNAIRMLIEGGAYDFGDRDDGSSRLDFLHIQDMTQAYIAVAERLEQVAGEAFNIGTGQATSIRELAVLISRLFDGKAREPIFRGPRKQHPAIKYLDTAKARRLLDWSPAVPLEEGLRQTIAWYRAHWARIDGEESRAKSPDSRAIDYPALRS
jgi:CDP-glucose 4,6-dehydratase